MRTGPDPLPGGLTVLERRTSIGGPGHFEDSVSARHALDALP